MNTLKERLAALDVPPPQRPCPVRLLIDQLDSDTGKLLERLLTEGRKSVRSIHSELTNTGIRIARESLSNHRNGWCRCAHVEKAT